MATPKPGRKKMASEGPKRSVAKPTAAQSAAAKKKAAVKKTAAEGPKRSTSKPSATASAIAKSKPKVVEAGVGNIPMTVARAAVAVGKKIAGNSAKAKTVSKPPKSNVKVIPKNAKVMKRTPPAKTLAEAARYKELARKRQELLNKK